MAKEKKVREVIGRIAVALDPGRSGVKAKDDLNKITLSAGYNVSTIPSGVEGEVEIDGLYYTFTGDGMVEDDPTTTGAMGIRADAAIASLLAKRKAPDGMYDIIKLSVTCQPGSIQLDTPRYQENHARGIRDVRIATMEKDAVVWHEYSFKYPKKEKITVFPQSVVVAGEMANRGEIKEGDEVVMLDIGGRSEDICLYTVRNGKAVRGKTVSVEHGCEKLKADIRDALYAKHINLSTDTINSAIMNGTVIHSRADEIMAVINTATDKFAQEAANIMTVKGFSIGGHVETCSGGCVLLENRLKKVGINIIKSRGEYANVESSYNWMMSMK